uniref:RING-type domain-containing protein n=1 Tax=Biomphalaria glabrata TaxID=6526 RepID=A0A2C9LU27_BIOGL
MATETPDAGLDCAVCRKPLTNPHMLPCLHVYCLSCLRDECRENSPDKFFCPLCVVDKEERRTSSARPWHAFEKIAESEAEQEAIQRRLAELPASEIRRDSLLGDYGDETDVDDPKSSLPKPPVLFPCSMHADNMADTFCAKCNQITCHKCISSFHRRCQDFYNIQDAIEKKRDDLDSIYSNIANNLAQCQKLQEEKKKRLKDAEEVRTRLLLDIKMFRGAMVKLIMAKEKALINEVDLLVDEMLQGTLGKESVVERLIGSLSRQLEVLNFSFSVNGQGELLPYLPSLVSRVANDAKKLEEQREKEPVRQFKFHKDDNCFQTLESSLLGIIQEEGGVPEAVVLPNLPEGKLDMSLTLLTSFHGGARDDVTDPLLTDIVLLPNGDVIVADRDNKCVKKFNQSGKLLTRVLIDAVPSRVTIVSNGRAAVSVMNKRAIYFLSLFGTIRVLSSVPVKKLYSFLTSDGNGCLAAATNQCDSIDLLTEKGEIIRTIYSQKSDRATISRPMYLTPVKVQSGTNVERDSTNGLTNIDFIVSDSGKKIVFMVNQSGQVIFSIKSIDSLTLECPLGVTVHESGLALFADRDANSVVLMDTTGTVIRRVLSADDGVVKPCGIYAGQRGYVAMTQVDGMVKIYSSSVVSM